MPDGTPAPSANTLILAAEDSPEVTIRPRFDAYGGDPSRVTILEGIKENGRYSLPSLKRDIELIKDVILERQIGLVILDPVSAYMTGSNRNQEGDVRDLLQPLVQLAEETGVAVLCIAHIGKGNVGLNPAQRIMGATAFVGVVRMVLMVDVLPDEYQIDPIDGEPQPPKRHVLEVVKTNISRAEPPLMYEAGETVRWLGRSSLSIKDVMDANRIPEVADSKKGQAEEWLRDQLAAGARPQQDIYESSDVSGSENPRLCGTFSKVLI